MSLRSVLFVILLVAFFEEFQAYNLRKRAVEANNMTKHEPPEICTGRTPCGWAVYTKFTRFIEYFMKNTCECSKDTKCVRDSDDISLTAFVYLCKTEESTTSS